MCAARRPTIFSPASWWPERMPNVVHVITWLDVGGAQKNTLLSCEGLVRRGWEVGLLHGTANGDPGDLLAQARQLGCDVQGVPALRREISPWRDLAATARLAFRLRRMRPDVVHTHSSKAGVVGRLAAKMAGVPVRVHTVHGWSFHDHMHPAVRRAYVALERIGDWAGTHCIVLAESDRAKGASAGIGDPHSYELIRSGIDLAPFRQSVGTKAAARERLGITPQSLLVGSVMRLAEPKDPLNLIRAFGQVHQKLPESELLIVGDGDLRAEVEAEVRRLELSSVVHLTGARDDVHEVVPAFDVFASSSVWEGLPRTVPEAAAAKIPIVATDAGGTREIIRDGETGWLVPTQRSDALATAIIEALSRPDEARRRAELADRESHSWDAAVMVERLDRLYLAALGSERLDP